MACKLVFTSLNPVMSENFTFSFLFGFTPLRMYLRLGDANVQLNTALSMSYCCYKNSAIGSSSMKAELDLALTDTP